MGPSADSEDRPNASFPYSERGLRLLLLIGHLVIPAFLLLSLNTTEWENRLDKSASVKKIDLLLHELSKYDLTNSNLAPGMRELRLAT